MTEILNWFRRYPMTGLMILCFLVGIPYFGGHQAYVKWQAYQAQATGESVIDDWIGSMPKSSGQITFYKQNTLKDQQAAILAEKKRGPYTEVTEDYLDDALFIGDSRTDTLKLYAGWDNATYYVKTGTNIWAILSDQVATDPVSGAIVSIEKALEGKQWGKIYIMLGVNELGTGTAETFYQQFKKVVERIRVLQPDSLIFVQSIMHVSAQKDAEGTSINNKNVNERNQWLAKLEDKEKIFFIDENEVLDDEEGTLTESYSFDGVHLKADRVEPWKTFILQHGVLK